MRNDAWGRRGRVKITAGLKSLWSARTDVLTNHHISPFFISSACYTHLQIYVTPPHTHTHTHTHTHKPYMLVCHDLCYMVLSQSPTTCLCLITCLCIIAFSAYQCFIVSTTCWCHIISATWSLLIASITSLCLIASIPWSCLIHFCVT